MATVIGPQIFIRTYWECQILTFRTRQAALMYAKLAGIETMPPQAFIQIIEAMRNGARS